MGAPQGQMHYWEWAMWINPQQCQQQLFSVSCVRERELKAFISKIDLPRQRVEHGARQRDAHVEAVAVPRDDGQHVGGGATGGLGHLTGKRSCVCMDNPTLCK